MKGTCIVIITRTLGLAAVALVSLASAHSASAQGTTTYDPAGSFSLAQNPNGVWSYGQTATLGGAFSLLPATQDATDGRGIQSYYADDGTSINYNTTSNNITFGSQTFRPNGLSIHDGMDGQLGVVRFTAPTAGTYSFTGTFYAGDTNANNTVFVLDNGTALFSGTRTGSNTTPFSSASLALAAGDTIDFAVGGQYAYGDTGLQATVTGPAAPVPEASTTASLGLLLVLGMSGLVIAARRKKVSITA